MTHRSSRAHRIPAGLRARRFAGALLIPALAALAACGGGGGGASTSSDPVLDLGVVSATEPSTRAVSVTNPLGSPATVTAGETEGPFALAPASDGATAPSQGPIVIQVAVTPSSPGFTTGELTLIFTAGSDTQAVRYLVRATIEAPRATLLTPRLDFGLVAPGATRDLDLRVRNDGTASAITLTSATGATAPFSVVGNPTPLRIEPGATGRVTVRYGPAAFGSHSGTLHVTTADGLGPWDVPMSGTSGEDEETIIDFGRQSLFGGATALLSVDVPADAVSLTIEGYLTGAGYVGLDSLTGPAGRVYENVQGTGAYVWGPGFEAFACSIPNTDRTNVQLVSGGGTYQFRLRRLSGTASGMDVRAIIERRSTTTQDYGRLDLNVWLADALTPTAATAPTTTRLQAILAQIGGILAQQGITIGDVDYYDVTDPTFDRVTEAEFPALLELTAGASRERLNLFFVEEAIGGGVVGVSATVGGVKRNGTSASGVMSVYSGWTTSVIGAIAAHEIGHYLGLYHTVEQNGSHDFMDDTSECPSSGTNGSCPTEGGGYLMHWQVVGGNTITDGQGRVVRGHPHLSPGVAPAGVAKPAFSLVDVVDAMLLPPNWCGTCADCAKHHVEESEPAPEPE